MATGNQFPKFNSGDPAEKLLNQKTLNQLSSILNSLNQPTIGRPTIRNGAATFLPDSLPPVEIALGMILEINTSTASTGFQGPTGEVNVIKVQKIDAVFEETVGTQDITQLDAKPNIVFAAADPDFSGAANDYVWMARWSNQWWVTEGAGGTSTFKHGIVRTLCDQGCNTYEVEIVERTFSESCTGTGTGTGTA
jgi:hypothetical protein